MIPEPKHGESWLRCGIRYASLGGVRSAAFREAFNERLAEGYSEERSVWLVLVTVGVL